MKKSSWIMDYTNEDRNERSSGCKYVNWRKTMCHDLKSWPWVIKARRKRYRTIALQTVIDIVFSTLTNLLHVVMHSPIGDSDTMSNPQRQCTREDKIMVVMINSGSIIMCTTEQLLMTSWLHASIKLTRTLIVGVVVRAWSKTRS